MVKIKLRSEVVLEWATLKWGNLTNNIKVKLKEELGYVNEGDFYSYINGDKQPSMNFLKRLANLMRFKIEELIETSFDEEVNQDGK